MKTLRISVLNKVKLSDAAYVDYAIAGLLVPISLAFGKFYEALVILVIMIVYYLIAKKLSFYHI